ncbi:hypothetical protein HYW75_03305 [Candidatus Pacearchaeota archaeon]|nr:hypothetical protein [Candidatus Pacearchaeota archaeon]
MHKKKRKTVEIIESSPEPAKEHIFYNFPGMETEDLTDYDRSTENRARTLRRKHEEIAKVAHGSLTHIHTHSSEVQKYSFLSRFLYSLIGMGREEFEKSKEMSALPGYIDLEGFLKVSRIRTMTIAVRDPKTGKVLGYHVMRKTKNTSKYDGIVEEDISKYEDEIMSALEHNNPKEASDAFDNFALKYHIKHRMLPAGGYTINKSRSNFVKKGKLEKAVSTLILIFLGNSLFFVSSNITGNAIANLSQKSSNWIGGVLFFIGIIGAFFYFRTKRSKK